MSSGVHVFYIHTYVIEGPLERLIDLFFFVLETFEMGA